MGQKGLLVKKYARAGPTIDLIQSKSQSLPIVGRGMTSSRRLNSQHPTPPARGWVPQAFNPNRVMIAVLIDLSTTIGVCRKEYTDSVNSIERFPGAEFTRERISG
jgi:hypothetical protein